MLLASLPSHRSVHRGATLAAGLSAPCPSGIPGGCPGRLVPLVHNRCVSNEVRLWLLGGFRAEVDGQPVPAAAWRRSGATALVKLLALRPGHRLHREQAIDRLWPEADATAGAARLNKALHFARRALGRDHLSLHDDLLSLAAGTLWVDLDGDDVVFNTARGRIKARNLEKDHRVAVSVIDPDDQYNVVAFRGTVVDVTTEGADAHIDALAKKYLGVDTYTMHREGEIRIRVTVRTDRIAMQG